MKRMILGLMLMMYVQPVFADALADSLKGYCEKIKQCAKAQMSEEDMQGMPEGMLKMMEQSLDSMCLGMVESYDKAVKHHDLYEPALACYQSMEKQSCDATEDETAACKRFGKLAEKYDN
jgi:hypothetical protein